MTQAISNGSVRHSFIQLNQLLPNKNTLCKPTSRTINFLTFCKSWSVWKHGWNELSCVRACKTNRNSFPVISLYSHNFPVFLYVPPEKKSRNCQFPVNPIPKDKPIPVKRYTHPWVSFSQACVHMVRLASLDSSPLIVFQFKLCCIFQWNYHWQNHSFLQRPTHYNDNYYRYYYSCYNSVRYIA